MKDRTCEGCNETYDYYPADSYGGDWYASCNICEWHSEDGGESYRIKQGLTLEELVGHKRKLDKLLQTISEQSVWPTTWRWAEKLQTIMGELIEVR